MSWETVAIVCAEASRVKANERAAQWDPDTGGAETFQKAPRASADGSLPGTHRVVVTQATPEMLTAIRDLERGESPQVKVFVASEEGWDPNETMARTLEARGLVRVVEVPDG